MSNQPTQFDFSNLDTAFREIPVNLGSRGSFVLREASEEVACKHRDYAMNNLKLKDGKVFGVSGLADLEPMLVGSCLFDNKNQPVGVEFVRSLPSRIVKPLFMWVQENSDMKSKEEGEEDTQGKS